MYLKAIQKVQREKDIEKVKLEDIGKEMCVEKNTVHDMVKKLIKKGFLGKTENGIYYVKINLNEYEKRNIDYVSCDYGRCDFVRH